MRDGKIHVLFLFSRCTPAGPIHVLRDILRCCSSDEFTFTLITTQPELPGNSILPEFTARMAHVFVPTAHVKGLLGGTGALRKEIDRLCPDVIHSTGVIHDTIVSRYYRKKQLVILHSDFLWDYFYAFGPLIGLPIALLQYLAARRARAAVAVSESLAEIYKKKYAFPVPYIRNGVTAEDMQPCDKQALREALGLPPERTIFVCAASLSRLKNQKFLIPLFESGEENGPMLLLLGDGPMLGKLKAKYKNAKSTRFMGFVPNVRKYYRAADYYVSASRSEGIGLSVLEAMAQGLPPVLSDIPAHREIVSLTRGAGECFTLNNASSFREAMQRLLAKDRAQASEKCREAVRAHFSAEAMSRAYQAYYRRIWEEEIDHAGR